MTHIQFNLFHLPADVLRNHIFSNRTLDVCSLGVSRFVCRVLRDLILQPEKSIEVEACRLGFLNILKWIFSFHKPCLYIHDMVCTAAENNHLEILKWLHGEHNYIDSFSSVQEVACLNGHLDIVYWLYIIKELRFPHDYPDRKSYLLKHIAKYGHLHIIQFLLQIWCIWDNKILVGAVEGKRLNVLIWAIENMAQSKKINMSKICTTAAYLGYLDVLQWARNKNCQWDERVCSNAAQMGHLDTLIWAHQNGAPLGAWALRLARTNNHTHVVEWLLDNGAPE